jgi:large conductance mechanosensitive channel
MVAAVRRAIQDGARPVHQSKEAYVSKLMRDFRDFLLQGNLITLAIAFVMGTAFAALLSAFVADIITPIVGMIFGKPDFSGESFTINSSHFFYGSFINAIIAFVAIAAAVFFFIVKPYEMVAARRSMGEEPAPPSDEERRHQELLAALQNLARP